MLAGSLKSNSSKKKKRHNYYYCLSHEKRKKAARKQLNSEHSSEADQDSIPPNTPDVLTPSQNSSEATKDFTDARPRTRSMSLTMDLPPLFFHPDPHLLVTQKVRLNPDSFFSDRTPPSTSLSEEVTSLQQSPTEESDPIPHRVTRQRYKEDHLQAIPEKQMLAFQDPPSKKEVATVVSRPEEIDNNVEFWDFHHLDLVWAKCAGYPSYPAIVSYFSVIIPITSFIYSIFLRSLILNELSKRTSHETSSFLSRRKKC